MTKDQRITQLNKQLLDLRLKPRSDKLNVIIKDKEGERNKLMADITSQIISNERDGRWKY